LRELPATLVDEKRKMLYAALWSLPSLALAFIVPLRQALLRFVLSAWTLALQHTEFPMVNDGFNFQQMRATLQQPRFPCLGCGGAVTAATTIPIANFAEMPAAVAGAPWCGSRSFAAPVEHGWPSRRTTRSTDSGLHLGQAKDKVLPNPEVECTRVFDTTTIYWSTFSQDFQLIEVFYNGNQESRFDRTRGPRRWREQRHRGNSRRGAEPGPR
jgi:hypothetical protein